jgi:hypothetical protein
MCMWVPGLLKPGTHIFFARLLAEDRAIRFEQIGETGAVVHARELRECVHGPDREIQTRGQARSRPRACRARSPRLRRAGVLDDRQPRAARRQERELDVVSLLEEQRAVETETVRPRGLPAELVVRQVVGLVRHFAVAIDAARRQDDRRHGKRNGGTIGRCNRPSRRERLNRVQFRPVRMSGIPDEWRIRACRHA